MQEHHSSSYPVNTGPHADLSEAEKKKRLDALVRIWQGDTEKRLEREGYRAFLQATGLDEYRYSAWLRLPEWERSAVVGQAITLGRSASGSPEDPVLFTSCGSASCPMSMSLTSVRVSHLAASARGSNGLPSCPKSLFRAIGQAGRPGRF